MKYRLIFQRTVWDGAESVWPDIRTVDIEIPDFDYSKEINQDVYHLIGGEQIMDNVEKENNNEN